MRSPGSARSSPSRERSIARERRWPRRSRHSSGCRPAGPSRRLMRMPPKKSASPATRRTRAPSPHAGAVDRARAALAAAVATLERLPPGRSLAKAYAYRAEEELFAGDTADAMAFADRALTLLEGRLDEVAVMALHIRGDARCSMGDLDAGLEDLEDALHRAEEA